MQAGGQSEPAGETPVEPRENAQQGRLAAARGADEAEELARLDRQVQVVEGEMGRRTGEAPGEIADGDGHRRRQAVTRRSRGMRTAHSISSTMAMKAMA